MKISFPYEKKPSTVFPTIKRPIAEVDFWSGLLHDWLRYRMLVDSGADYTILPKDDAVNLGINLEKDCLKKTTRGVGGNQTVYFLKRKAKVKVGGQPFSIPLGFLNSNQIPPLLGREGCLNLFRVLLANFRTEISL